MPHRARPWTATTLALCCLLLATSLIGSSAQAGHVSAAQVDASPPPELTAAPANTSDLQILAGEEIDWFTTKFSNNMHVARWTLPPGTATDVHFSGLELFSVETGTVILFDSDGNDAATLDAPDSLLLKKHDPRNYSLRNDSNRCASVLVLKVNALETVGGGGGGTWTDEDGPQLAAEAPCGTDAEEHLLVNWDQPLNASSPDLETFADGPLYIFIARKTMQPDSWMGRHSYTGPVGMYVEQGQLWLPAEAGPVLLGPGGLTLITTGRGVSESTGFGQPTTVLLFGVVSAVSEPGPDLMTPRESTRLSVDRNTYQSPSFPFSLTWNYSWVVTNYSETSVRLTNGPTDASFRLSTSSGDPATCVSETASQINAFSGDKDYVIAQGTDGKSLAGTSMNDQGYFAIYYSPTQTPVHYIECIAIDGGAAMLTMEFIVDINDYANEAPALDELRFRIRLND